MKREIKYISMNRREKTPSKKIILGKNNMNCMLFRKLEILSLLTVALPIWGISAMALAFIWTN